jgi:hypothetical protein
VALPDWALPDWALPDWAMAQRMEQQETLKVQAEAEAQLEFELVQG